MINKDKNFRHFFKKLLQPLDIVCRIIEVNTKGKNQMNVKECYEKIGNYDEALSRLMKDSLIAKFAVKFESDPSFDSLRTALAEENFEDAFRHAHTLKGVAANLALSKIGSTAGELTEILRDKQKHDVSALMQKLDAEYHEAVENIRKIEL